MKCMAHLKQTALESESLDMTMLIGGGALTTSPGTSMLSWSLSYMTQSSIHPETVKYAALITFFGRFFQLDHNYCAGHLRLRPLGRYCPVSAPPLPPPHS